MTDRLSLEQRMRTAFADLVAAHPQDGFLQYRIDRSQLPEVARFLHERLKGRLALLFAIDCRPRAQKYEIQYLFALSSGQPWVLLTAELVGSTSLFTSITPSVHAAQ